MSASPFFLQNLAEKAPDANLGSMLVAGNLLPLIQSFSTRKWSDDELKDDIDWLKEQLEEAKRKMTSVRLDFLASF